jgi:hypothetical protein
MNPLPYEIMDAMIQCFGRSFFYKDPMSAFLYNCEVPRALADKHRHEHKFVWARKLLTELGESESGRVLQRRVLTALCQLRNLPDKEVPDRAAGLDALRNLKDLALAHDLVARDEVDRGTQRKQAAAEHTRILQERSAKLESLRQTFNAAAIDSNRQAAGYSLEDLLRELFSLFELEYRKSYRTETQQIDGCFNFQGFDYLVEAKWRSDQPTEQELGGFQRKVNTKLESTRGLFVSVPGFRPAVAAQCNGYGANLILMDGRDLIHVLDGRTDLRDGLKKKIERAAQEGIVFTPLYLVS